MFSPLWIDSANALDRLKSSQEEDYIKKIAKDLIVDGMSIIKNAHTKEACKDVINDYESWKLKNSRYVNQNLDSNGHEKRLVDFHHTSEAAERIGNNPKILKALDFIFGMESGIYTSLTFKYSTQQPVHRDIPHFATWPENYFVGVWTALEDVSIDAGPLFYYKGAHRFKINPCKVMEEAKKHYKEEITINRFLSNPREVMKKAKKYYSEPANEEITTKALDIYCGIVIDYCSNLGDQEIIKINAGDTVIWHPQLPHGGMPMNNLDLTRWSIVFHCAPVDIQVYQHREFFKHAAENMPSLLPRYGFRTVGTRKIAVAGRTAYM